MEDQSTRPQSENSGTLPEPTPAAGKDNRQVIKALVVGGDEGAESPALPQDRGKGKAKAQEDYWGKYEDVFIEAPVDIEFLATVEEYSTILQQCVEVYEVNIEGFGYMLRPLLSLDQLEATDPKRAAMSKERARIDNFLKGATGDDTLTAFRRKCRHDLESTGNTFFELVRHPFTALPDKFVHVPSYQIRLGKLDDEFTEYTQYRQVEVEPGVFKVEQVRDLKRFRRFLQLQYGLASGPGVVWFKEYGDPRVIDCRNGQVVEEKKAKTFPLKYRASEMVHRRIYSSRTPYGLPRYKGCLITLLGDREAEEVNYTTLKNNNIPSMIVAVSNGQVTSETIDRIKEFTKEQIQGSKNYSRFLILEAEGVFDAHGTDFANMRLDIKPLTPYQSKDQLFQEYGKANREKIRQCFRLPPIFIGVSEDYTRATAEASRRLADEQIFRPERDEVDALFNRILFEFEMSFHVFKSNGPNITDDEDLLKLLIAGEKAGGMTPRIASEIVDDILGRPSREIWPEGIKPDEPFSLQMAERVKNKAQPNEPGQQVTALKRMMPEPADALSALMYFRDQLVTEIQQRKGE